MLRPYMRLRDQIAMFWLEPDHREVPSWTEHEDINDVMLATTLVPDCFLPRHLGASSTIEGWQSR